MELARDLAPTGLADVSRPPFAATMIRLDLPPPISVNKSRKINWKSHKAVEKWLRNSDMKIMAGGGVRRLGKINGKFEVLVTLDEHLVHCDADNCLKILIDYCRRLELIIDDSKKYMRKVTVEWGHAPYGCRIELLEVA